MLQRIISLGLIRWKKISFMTYFDWKYYKELLIGNKELGKVQQEFTVVVIKIKNVSAFIAEFSPPSLCMSKKKRKKKEEGFRCCKRIILLCAVRPKGVTIV